MVERGGRAKVRHVKSSGARVLLPAIERSVDVKATVYSDDWKSYKGLRGRGFYHDTIVHSNRQYVNGLIHTQNVENLRSTMKRGIKGVYRHVDAKYLQAYADEYAFRYSHRKSDEPMFMILLNRVAAKN